MGLFDSITGAASQRAARNNSVAIQAGLTQGSNAINGGYGNALNTLLDGQNPSAFTALGSGYNQARSDVTGQYDQTQGFLGRIGSLYDPLVSSGTSANNARSDALGLNGAEGNARASTAFQGSLGYGAGLDTGLDAVMRSAAARGNLAGGNTSRDLFDYGADYQNRQAGSYIDRLSGVAQNLNTGLAGQATGLGLQGQASQQQGTSLGALGTGLGQGNANLFSTGANLEAQQGQSLANLAQGVTGQLVQNNNQLAQSQNQASANALGGLMGIGSLLTGGFGGSSIPSASGGANVSPYAGNPLLSGIDRFTNIFR